jgi:serine/threonine protein kinase
MPPEDVLNEVSDVQSKKVTIPVYRAVEFSLGTQDAQLVNLLERLLAIDSRERITAKESLNHSYFHSLSPAIKTL